MKNSGAPTPSSPAHPPSPKSRRLVLILATPADSASHRSRRTGGRVHEHVAPSSRQSGRGRWSAPPNGAPLMTTIQRSWPRCSTRPSIGRYGWRPVSRRTVTPAGRSATPSTGLRWRGRSTSVLTSTRRGRGYKRVVVVTADDTTTPKIFATGTPKTTRGRSRRDRRPATGDTTAVDCRLIAPPSGAVRQSPACIYRHTDSAANGGGLFVAWRGDMDALAAPHTGRARHCATTQPHLPTRCEVDYKPPEQGNEASTSIRVKPWSPDKHKVANVLEAIEALDALDRPTSIRQRGSDLHSAAETDAAQMISCENGLLDLSTRTIHDHTPALFNVVSVPFAYHENAPESHRVV